MESHAESEEYKDLPRYINFLEPGFIESTFSPRPAI